MSTELDNGQVRELSIEVKQLSGDIRELKTEVKNLIEHTLPAITVQGGTIQALDNKVVRFEGKLGALEDRVREYRIEQEGKVTAMALAFDGKIAVAEKKITDAEDRQKARGDANQRLIITVCTIIAVFATLANFAINNLHWKQ